MSGVLYGELSAFCGRGLSRFCMPGHKGNRRALPFLRNAAALDLTETPLTGDLYEENGFFADSAAQAARTVGVLAVLYCAGGSTLSLQALMTAYFKRGDRVLLCRDSHRAPICAAHTAGIEIKWAAPTDGFGCDTDGIIAALDGVDGAIVTSPDYYGRRADVAGIARECKKRGIPLLVDAAHGAHFPLVGLPYPVAEGADAAVISLHKTLPALTGASAVLLSEPSAAQKVRRQMAVWGSSSPSYLISLSIENAFEELQSGAERWAKTRAVCDDLRSRFEGLFEYSDDPTRLCVDLTGTDVERVTRLAYDRGISAEYIGETAVFICSPYNTKRDFKRLEKFCSDLAALPRSGAKTEIQQLPRRIMSAAAAVAADSERVDAAQTLGRIAAQAVCVCPPCRVLIDAGEEYGEKQTQLLKKYSICAADVVKSV